MSGQSRAPRPGPNLNDRTPWLEVFRCSVCDEVFSSQKSCQQHCSQPNSRCNHGRDRSKFATVIPVQVRVDNRVVGGQVRSFLPAPAAAGRAYRDQDLDAGGGEDIQVTNQVCDSGDPSEQAREQRCNVPGVILVVESNFSEPTRI
jgi:hypothetical protein